MSYQEAEYLLAKRTRVGHSAWHKFKKSVLRELCWALNLPVAASGRNGRSIRKDYVEAIINFRERRTEGRSRPRSPENTWSDSSYPTSMLDRATPEVWSSQVETCQDWHFTDFLTRMLFTSDYIDLGVQTWRRAVIFAIVLQILIFIIKHLLKDFGL